MRPLTTVSATNTSISAGTPSMTSRKMQYAPSGMPRAATTAMYARVPEESGRVGGLLTRLYRQLSGAESPQTR
jgi:hypothetical protein